MKKDVRFHRNVYIILLSILLLAALIQLARSSFILEFTAERQVEVSREALMEDAKTIAAIHQSDGPYYCVGYTGSDKVSVLIKDNALQTLLYMQHPSRAVDLESDRFDYSQCSGILITTEQLDQLRDISSLLDFVEDGGSVFLMQGPVLDDNFNSIYRKLGILSFGDAKQVGGIHLTSNVLIGERGLSINSDVISTYSLSVGLDDNSILLAESGEGVPLMWYHDYNKGRFVVFNGDLFQEKANRGLIAGGVSFMEPDSMYPIFDSKVFFIDDFPSPIPKGIDASIEKNYGMDIPTFFHDIWWPDMLKASQRYDVKYSSVVIESYNDQVNPPFANPIDQERHGLIAFGREVLKSGGEIGIHGFNHQSLLEDEEIAQFFDYQAWSGKDEMALATKEVVSYVHSAFPNYTPSAYVPPSNVLSEEGREALKEAWPELAVISSLYDTDYSNRSYVQEFEVAADGIIEMPRVTSGYGEDPYSRWIMANTINSVGVFSHFIHPDDLLDEERSHNKSWKDLYKEFTALLKGLNQRYPWLEPRTSTDAALNMVNVLRTQLSLSHQPDQIEGSVANYQKPINYILRTERKIAKLNSCSVKKIDENVYLVTVFASKFSIGLGV